MIIPLITTPWAQWSYDSVKDDGLGEHGNAPLAHLGIHIGNIVAHTALPIHLTRMSNPHILSYAYKGLDPAKFGMKAAMQSRREFQIASSAAYRAGAAIGGHLAWPSNAPVFLAETAKGKRAASAIARGSRIGGRVGARLIPGLGWAMLAYDAYDLVANQRLFGVQL